MGGGGLHVDVAICQVRVAPSQTASVDTPSQGGGEGYSHTCPGYEFEEAQDEPCDGTVGGHIGGGGLHVVTNSSQVWVVALHVASVV
jgi:hypothetical protein